MNAYTYTLNILRVLSVLDQHIKLNEGDNVAIENNGSELASFSSDSVSILGLDLSNKAIPSRHSKTVSFIEEANLQAFLKSLGSGFKGLNHVGVGYSCSSFSGEILSLKNAISGTSLKLYEEESGSENDKWLWVGNSASPEEPIFEVVLSLRPKPIVSSTTPHLQIDIDTSLSFEDVKNLALEHLGPNSIIWELYVPGYGTPLIMAKLASINSMKVLLGIGTDKRGTREWHRTEGMSEVR